jgi:ribosomal protein uL24
MPVRKGDEVKVTRGKFKGTEGKVTCVYRKKYVIHIEKCTRDNNRGSAIPVGLDASKVVITKLHPDKSRKAILARKDRKFCGKSKDSFAAENRDNLAGVD